MLLLLGYVLQNDQGRSLFVTGVDNQDMMKCISFVHVGEL
jgi:hypothetical protein